MLPGYARRYVNLRPADNLDAAKICEAPSSRRVRADEISATTLLCDPMIATPWLFPEMTLPAPAAVPPTLFPAAPLEISTPANPFASAAVPRRLVPM